MTPSDKNRSEQSAATQGEIAAPSNGRPRKKAKKKKGTAASDVTSRFYGIPLPGVNLEELSGSLIVLEGSDGSGRSTQIALLTEWLESEGFAVQTMGLRRSFLVGEDIDSLMAENAVTRTTLALMYSTDFFDQLERRILPALRSGLVVLADRYIFTLIARSAVRGMSRDYLHGIYEMALRPDLTFWLNVKPEIAFDREFKKAHTISYWESGRDMSLSNDLFQSFIRYQSMMKKEFEYLSKRHGFVEVDGEGSVSEVNRVIRKRIAAHLGIQRTHYQPSHALMQVWR
ncbi:MAG TPA: dTMP kinase [Candidatus Aquilonibacter sp.]|nr:dTMP kinase [Candidatus Aquilonibacter sp.]